jgi:glyoxylase-like metal-dependent hydrolase (beta-lactamase superfamily II)
MRKTPILICLLALLLTFNAFAQAHHDEPLPPDWCKELPRAEYKRLHQVESTDPWFEVYRVRPGVFAIYEPHQFEEVISYLIVGQTRALLFDTGIGVGDIHKVVARLTALPLTVLNSHTHYDHVGGNADFTDILGVDSEFTRDNAGGGVNRYGVSEALIPERLCGALPVGVTRQSYKIRPWKITHAVHDGDMIDLGGRKLEILFTPGHTPDSLMLLDRANKMLFTGDMFYSGPIYLYTPETNFVDYTTSIARVSKLTNQLQLLLPSHNVPVADPDKLLELNAAVQDVNSGRAKALPSEGNWEYRFDGFSLLLAPHGPTMPKP